jgi:hypothetical protein
MKNLKPCIFCGSEDVSVCNDLSQKGKYFWVQCNHCAASGSSYGAITMIDGDFEETDEELITEAIKSWNEAGHPTILDKVKRFLNQIKIDFTSIMGNN